jgi:hypothetical protein
VALHALLTPTGLARVQERAAQKSEIGLRRHPLCDPGPTNLPKGARDDKKAIADVVVGFHCR